jgi:hypothetical protein
MDLQQWFYILGISFIASWFLILIALVVGGVLAYKRYKKLRANVVQRGAMLFTASSLLKHLPLTKIVPIITAMPVLTHIFKSVMGKHKRKSSL